MSMQIPIGGGQTTTLRDMIGQIAGQGKQRQLVVDLDLDLVAGGLSWQELLCWFSLMVMRNDV